ncbi:hypothetical protein Lalb_Chr16g0377591 [Lupinus albus]|uniref:Uncharacterized protein n=1 Tax=Lupinus albus TaxID=3870 RepID=A0A6A4P4M0_LUPAL|nr:hypothetical protein Lalb_Chr16g0377591 [Lupinus albus]
MGLILIMDLSTQKPGNVFGFKILNNIFIIPNNLIQAPPLVRMAKSGVYGQQCFNV